MRLPAEFTVLRAGAVRAAVRRDLTSELGAWLVAPALALPDGAERLATGRGGAFRVTLPGGRRAVVRQYRRGGMLARWVRETYLGPRPRPLHELAVTVEAGRRGVAVPEVLGARVEGGLVYRGAIVTAEIPNARPVLEALRDAAGEAGRRAVAEGAARAVADLHHAGVMHADLNLNNLVVHDGNTGAVTVLDLDRARLRPTPLAARARRRALRRLRRSLAKLDPGGTLVLPAELAAFHAAYTRSLGAACAC